MIFWHFCRFDEAVKIAERAEKDHNNREVSAVIRRVKAVASARNEGNKFFKASKYADACAAYGEGLHHDPMNAILLCNRAGCYSKLGQWEKAIEDCNTVLNLKPSYAKARLRRADCFAKVSDFYYLAVERMLIYWIFFLFCLLSWRNGRRLCEIIRFWWGNFLEMRRWQELS